MQIGIMGAGAVGSFYGAMLARAGHDVVFVGRPAFVDRVAAEGLCLEMDGARHVIRACATTRVSELSSSDIVIFSIKSADTEAAGREMAPYLKANATVLSFQNGVDNAERLQSVLQRPVIPTVVYVATEMAGPGHVLHHGRGDLVFGPSSQSEAVATFFQDAGVAATISDQVMQALWRKLVINCAYNALSAVAQVPYGKMVEVDGVTALMADVVAECVAVARALGVGPESMDMEQVLGIARSMPGQYSSTAQDIARRRPSEIDYLNGYVVRKGAELGVPTPANRALHVMVKLVEAAAR